ncbi:MAG: helix-turn-helix transcriptional regulator, partial [Opitutaceae bacterium]|nr:helix-turn-helix transcriptional regulator [Opitutaceae bacterium]
WERPPSPQAVRLVAATLGLLLLRLSSAAASAPAPAAGSVFLKKTNALIEASPGRMLTVKTLAGSLHMSESHARRLFREETSLSLGHYLRERRIARAMTLLRSNAHPDITAVGEACGFGSLYSFSRAFRKATSLSPRSYASRTVGRGV